MARSGRVRAPGLFDDDPEVPPPAPPAGLRARRAAAADAVLARLETLSANAVAGLDEAGRGPLAGPVVAGAVVLDPTRPIAGLADSKQLTAARREHLLSEICDRSLGWGLGWVWPDEIETLNIHHASLLAMRRAFAAMLGLAADARAITHPGLAPDARNRVLPPSAVAALSVAVADGAHAPDLSGLGWSGECVSLVKGDDLAAAVSAASILAKQARDHWMVAYDAADPRYGFAAHMGYPTERHAQALREHGPCAIHRMSWVEKFLKK